MIERELGRAVIDALTALRLELEHDPSSGIYVDPMIHDRVDGYANAPAGMSRCESLSRLLATSVRALAGIDIGTIDAAIRDLDTDEAQVTVRTALPVATIVSALRRFAQSQALSAQALRDGLHPIHSAESPWGDDEHVARDTARWAREGAELLAKQVFPQHA